VVIAKAAAVGAAKEQKNPQSDPQEALKISIQYIYDLMRVLGMMIPNMLGSSLFLSFPIFARKIP